MYLCIIQKKRKISANYRRNMYRYSYYADGHNVYYYNVNRNFTCSSYLNYNVPKRLSVKCLASREKKNRNPFKESFIAFMVYKKSPNFPFLDLRHCITVIRDQILCKPPVVQCKPLQ